MEFVSLTFGNFRRRRTEEGQPLRIGARKNVVRNYWMRCLMADIARTGREAV